MKKTTNKLPRETDKCRASYSQKSKCIVEIMYEVQQLKLHYINAHLREAILKRSKILLITQVNILILKRDNLSFETLRKCTEAATRGVP